MNACKENDAIDSGADPEDFLVLVGLLWRVPPTAAGEAQVKRILATVYKGLGVKVEPS